MSRIIAITDIHGCYHTMVDLINKLNINFHQDKVIFLGDYIDRGLNPLKVVNTLRDLQSKHKDNVVILKGNHEDMCVNYYKRGTPTWGYNNCYTTKRDLAQLSDSELKILLNFMENLPDRYETRQYRFCHSGCWSDEFFYQHLKKILWDKDWLEYPEDNSPDKPVVFGHTVHAMPTFYGKHICIDTGCVFYKAGYGCLTAAILNDENDNVEFIGVDINEKDCEDI